ncbi:hypothetical protein CK203_087821 [Vitis vinifera]|uniref:Uncharacterized protein n=1 Tax=Vitis vinifera TaxID=29760 RepID=A0A438E437_VITVI|nr:hypothetical protein CK203_087821 [Vitis vinifera]
MIGYRCLNRTSTGPRPGREGYWEREKVFDLPRSVLDRTISTGRPVPQPVDRLGIFYKEMEKRGGGVGWAGINPFAMCFGLKLVLDPHVPNVKSSAISNGIQAFSCCSEAVAGAFEQSRTEPPLGLGRKMKYFLSGNGALHSSFHRWRQCCIFLEEKYVTLFLQRYAFNYGVDEFASVMSYLTCRIAAA